MEHREKKQRLTPLHRLLLIIAVLIGGYGIAVAAYMLRDDAPLKTVIETPVSNSEPNTEVPKITSQQLFKGYSNIWDMVFIDDNTVLFDERGGKLHIFNRSINQVTHIGGVPNVRAEGEGGLLGLALDKDFSTNRYVYACYNHDESPLTVRVTRFTLSSTNEPSGYTDIIDDIESKAGRHSGCRMAMDKNGHLWISTGDSAIGKSPQNPKSLAGKVLRVDREGKGVNGNAGEPFDNRIYNSGHRNIQGLVLFDQPAANGAMGLTSEHGPSKEDEINWILPGNFGWDPVGGDRPYNERVPMTDLDKFPDAVPAIWNSGGETIAVSGLELLTHERWGAWQGWVAMAVLKNQHVRLIDFAEDGKVQSEQEIVKKFGRIRAVRQAPDGSLFISTDNGSGKDGIIQVTTK